MKNEEFIVRAISELNENMDISFREMRNEMNSRFEEVNKRFDQVEARLDRIETEQKGFRKDITFLSRKIGEHELVLNRITNQ